MAASETRIWCVSIEATKSLPYAPIEAVQEAVGQEYVIMWRQKASDVVFPGEVETIRRDLENGCRQLQGYRYQIVLRELQTLSGHPDRLHEWTQAAVEMAARSSRSWICGRDASSMVAKSRA